MTPPRDQTTNGSPNETLPGSLRQLREILSSPPSTPRSGRGARKHERVGESGKDPDARPPWQVPYNPDAHPQSQVPHQEPTSPDHGDNGAAGHGLHDTGYDDTGLFDTGRVDTGRLDTGRLDTGRLDTGRLDTGRLDTGRLDTGRLDTGRRDNGVDNGPETAAEESAQRGSVLTARDVYSLFDDERPTTTDLPDDEEEREGTADIDADGATGRLPVVPPTPRHEVQRPEEELEASPVLRPRRLRDRTYQRRFGVAPFVRPSARRNRRKRRRDYRKLGFIELTQEKMRLRHRIFPRTVLGISVMILALGVGAAFAGATLYAYYDFRQSQHESQVQAFAKGFENEYSSAIGQVQAVRDGAIKSVNDAIQPLQDWQNDANAVVALPTKVGGGVWTLRTLDANGHQVVGSAFVVNSDANSSLLLTAWEMVGAATAQPGPKVTLEKNGEQLQADVWSWDPEHDLALLKVGKGNMPTLPWAPEQVRSSIKGVRVYAMSGLAGAGSKAVGGMVIDQSQVGLQHNIQIAPDFRGGPVVTADGRVVAVTTGTYRPLGFDPGNLLYAPDVTMACINGKVLVCPPALTGASGAGKPGR